MKKKIRAILVTSGCIALVVGGSLIVAGGTEYPGEASQTIREASSGLPSTIGIGLCLYAAAVLTYVKIGINK
jgi:hypothetical protein